MRVEGRVVGDNYEVRHGDIAKTIPLADAKGDKKLAGAIKANKWEPLP